MDNVHLAQALRQQPLFLDDSDQPLEINPFDLQTCYLPLSHVILARAGESARFLVAIAGPPGSGKSAFAALLCAVINHLDPTSPSIDVGLDGWHFPNSILDTHFIHRNGERITLRSIKGAPESFDTTNVSHFIEQVVIEQTLPFPIYSRKLHEPVPDAGRITAAQRILLLEGNYWLLDEPPWNRLATAFGLRIFLTATSASLLDGLRARHLRGGKTAPEAEAHLQRVDLPNIRRVLAHTLLADIVIRKASGLQIAGVDWKNSSA